MYGTTMNNKKCNASKQIAFKKRIAGVRYSAQYEISLTLWLSSNKNENEMKTTTNQQQPATTTKHPNIKSNVEHT